MTDFQERVARICNRHGLPQKAASELLAEASKADELHHALRRVMEYAGGWDSPPDHPCGMGRDALELCES